VSQTTPTLTIRPAEPSDLDSIMAIEEASFASPWARQAMIEELGRTRGAVFLAAESEGRFLGYASAWVYAGEAHVMNIAVAPADRGRGTGEALLLTLLERALRLDARLAYLEVRPGNREAIALYTKLGFRPYGRRPRYYADSGEDALLMACKSLRQLDLPGRWEVWEQRHGARSAE
jgi:ribosomal-protein-alanine N-acetyltransferase